jgi:hypothetical protein
MFGERLCVSCFAEPLDDVGRLAGLRRRYARRAATITADRGPTWSMRATKWLGIRAETIVRMRKVYDMGLEGWEGPVVC